MSYFSMLAVAASHDMGMALIPQMLIESELQKGTGDCFQ